APFSATYQVDIATAAYPTPLGFENPPGSLIYDPSAPGWVNVTGDTDSFTLAVDDGQTITVLVTPAAGLRPTVELRDPGNALLAGATATAAGGKALLQTVPTTTGGTYTITVGGFGTTTGTYTVQVFLNAALEAEANGGAANSTPGSAQDLGPSFITLE